MSYFTLRTIIVLMETIKDFYSSTTIPPSAGQSPPGATICAFNEYAASQKGLLGRQVVCRAALAALIAKERPP